jgi:hypothetical protein
MSTVSPPPPPSAPAQPPAPPPSAVVTTPPPALLALDFGARLDALITGLDPLGRILVSTRLGPLALQTNIALPASGPVQLQVQSLGTQVLLLITAIHGKPPQAFPRLGGELLAPTLPGPATTGAGKGAGPGAASPGAANPAAGQASGPAAPVTLTQGATLGATLLQPGSALITGAAPPSAGGVNLAGAGRASANTGPQTPTAAAQPATPGTSATPAQAIGKVALPAGSGFTVRIVSVQPGAQAQAPAVTGQPLSLGMAVSGVATQAAGPGTAHGLVQTPAGLIAIATPTPLPAGTAIQFEVTQLPQPEAGAQDRAVALRLGQVIAEQRQWSALDEAARTLMDAQPVTAQQLIHGAMPRADANLTANLLFFLFALRGGDVRQWLGDAPARALEKLKPALIARLKDDFAGIARVRTEPDGPEPRPFPVPFFNGQEIEQLRLLVRRREDDEDEDDDRRKGPGVRFVVDVEMSRLGRLQLDGFVQDGTKRFDLIVRSDARLPDRVQNGIRGVFEGANETTGVTGGLAFQAAPANFVGTDAKADDGGLGLMV